MSDIVLSAQKDNLEERQRCFRCVIAVGVTVVEAQGQSKSWGQTRGVRASCVHLSRGVQTDKSSNTISFCSCYRIYTLPESRRLQKLDVLGRWLPPQEESVAPFKFPACHL
jgi:hypothetical protein